MYPSQLLVAGRDIKSDVLCDVLKHDAYELTIYKTFAWCGNRLAAVCVERPEKVAA